MVFWVVHKESSVALNTQSKFEKNKGYISEIDGEVVKDKGESLEKQKSAVNDKGGNRGN